MENLNSTNSFKECMSLNDNTNNKNKSQIQSQSQSLESSSSSNISNNYLSDKSINNINNSNIKLKQNIEDCLNVNKNKNSLIIKENFICNNLYKRNNTEILNKQNKLSFINNKFNNYSKINITKNSNNNFTFTQNNQNKELYLNDLKYSNSKNFISIHNQLNSKVKFNNNLITTKVNNSINNFESNYINNNNISSAKLENTRKVLVDSLKRGALLIKMELQQYQAEVDTYLENKNKLSLKQLITSESYINFHNKELLKTDLLDKIFLYGMADLVDELLHIDKKLFNINIEFLFNHKIILNIVQQNLIENNYIFLSLDKDIENFDLIFDYKHSSDIVKLKKYFNDYARYKLYLNNNDNNNSIVLKNTNLDYIFLIVFLCACYGFYNEFNLIIDDNKNNIKFIEDNIYTSYNNFSNTENIDNFSFDYSSINKVIIYCLQNNYEQMAICIYSSRQIELKIDIIELAVKHLSLTFLKYIWENTFRSNYYKFKEVNNKFLIKSKYISKSELLDNYYNKYIKNNKISFLISDIIEKSIKNKTCNLKFNEILKNWDYLEFDRNLLNVLFKYNLYDDILILIHRDLHDNWKFEETYFCQVIKQKECSLIEYFINNCSYIKKCLNSYTVQNIIVNNYMLFGSKIYYGTEMICNIFKTNWHEDLTKDLCKHILKTIKTKDIMNCHSPILTCVLLSEFLNNIASISVHHYSRLEKVVKSLLQFCENIQYSTNDESYIKFLMDQTSFSGRSAFIISARNNFFSVLSNPNIGTIVNKMWNGDISYNSFFKASSLHRFLENSKIKHTDPLLSFEKLDNKKSYFFQLSVWEHSCSLRYFPESFYTIILIIVYNLYLYVLSLDKREGIENWYKLSNNSNAKLLFWMYYIQILCININIYYMMIISYSTKNTSCFNTWNYVELALLFFTNILFIDFHNIINYELGDYIYITILCIIDVLVWVRIAGILLTWKNLGPVIRMIFSMALLLMKYILIYSLFIICMSAVFTSMFFGSSQQFESFTTSLITLIGPFVQQFDTKGFKHNNLLGAIILIIYTSLTAIMLINLLIAVLSNVYDELSKQVDASHRAILINYYENIKWNKYFGYTILLPNPLNIVNLFTLPIQIIFGFNKTNKQKTFNKILCKIYYSIFYFPFILVIFVIYSLIIFPFCYLKCVFLCIKLAFSYDHSNYSSCKNNIILILIKNILLSPLFIFYYNLRDVYLIITNVYNKVDKPQSNIDRIKKYISNEDIYTFIDFINQRKIINNINNNTLNDIFIEYLQYEKDKKLEINTVLKEKNEYLKRVSNITSNNNPNSTKSTLYIANHLKQHNTNNFNSIKKNLIIIDILENFLVTDESEESIVDIKKLKTLLPKTLKIDDNYISRLLYTNMSLINKAINKLKSSKTNFIQYQLISKITNCATKLDKEIDYEISKNITLKKTEKKLNNKNTTSFDSLKGYKNLLQNLNNISEDLDNKIKQREDKLIYKDKLKEANKTKFSKESCLI